MILGDKPGDAICRLYEQLKGRRGNFESHWEEVAERIYPSASKYFTSQIHTKGEKRNQNVFDSTASTALNRFASILDSYLTPRTQMWHNLVPSDPMLMKDRSARLWFEETNRVLFKFRYATKANYAGQNQLNFKSLGAFGTGALYIDSLQSREGGLRYKNCHLGEVFIMENHQGIVDTVIRHFPLTARQAVQKFKKERLSSGLLSALENDPEKEFFFLHYVGPNQDISHTRVDYKGMEYSSYYVALEGKEVVEEGGYNTFPYTPSRYEQAPNEVYGRGPAIDVLPNIKTINEQKKTLLKQGHRAVDPVILVHDDGILDTFSLKPGHANAGGVNKDGRPLVHTLPVGSIDTGRDMMDDERVAIKDAFLTTLFQILVENPGMTATEVMERTREKGVLIAPTLGRQESERLGPQIERELDVLSQQDLLPEMPPILVEAGASFEVEYNSPFSRSQRAEEVAGLMRSWEMTGVYVNATGDTSPYDHYNMDAIVPDISDANAVPLKWRKSTDDIQKIRQSRAQAAETQQAIEAAPAMAGMMKAQPGKGA